MPHTIQILTLSQRYNQITQYTPNYCTETTKKIKKNVTPCQSTIKKTKKNNKPNPLILKENLEKKKTEPLNPKYEEEKFREFQGKRLIAHICRW